MAVQSPLENLLTLFNIEGKRDAEAHCRKIVIRDDDLVGVLLAGRAGCIGQYLYTNHFADLAAENLEPSNEELTALGRSAVGQTLSGRALKAARKMDQLFVERRLLAAHLFYSRSLKYWHLFYFDQRDYQTENNHWKHGPHLHYSRESFAREPLPEVWRKVCQARPEFPRSVHVRYDYRRNRKSRCP